MKTLAIGRICQDEFYLVRAAKNRIASTKLTADYIGRQFGGSVFSVAKMLCEAGVDCTFMSGMAEGDFLSCQTPDFVKIIKTPTTPRSFIYIKDQYKLDRICSVGESKEEKIQPSAELLDWVEKLEKPRRLVYDLRQAPLTKAVLDRMYHKVELTVLDPGSTAFYTEDGEEMQEIADVISHSDVICAGSDFYEHYAHYSRLSAYFSYPLFQSAKLLIATLPDGRNIFATRDFCLTVSRLNQLSIGNTMGAGDAFRGAFLSAWKESRDGMTYEAVLAGAKRAVAAATLKIEDKRPLPQMPTANEISAFCECLALRIKKDDSML